MTMHHLFETLNILSESISKLIITQPNIPINYLESTDFIIQSGNGALLSMNNSNTNFEGSNNILIFDILSGDFYVYNSSFEIAKYSTKLIWAKNVNKIMIHNCNFTDDNDEIHNRSSEILQLYEANYRCIDYPQLVECFDAIIFCF